MLSIPVEIEVDEVACVIYPVDYNEVGMPIVDVITQVIEDKMDMGYGEVAIKQKGIDFYIPEWRCIWFTWGDVPVPNPSFDRDRISREDGLTYIDFFATNIP